MKKRYLWFIAIVLIVVYCFLKLGLIKAYDLSYELDRYWITIDGLANILFLFATGMVLSYLISLIPFQHRSSRSKFFHSLPFVMIIVTNFLVFLYGLLAYNGKKETTMVKFNDVKTCSIVDCNKVKEGLFEQENVFIERKGNLQIETEKVTSKKFNFHAEWISDCEYHLISKNDSLELVKVKITRVFTDYYEYAVTLDQEVMRGKVYRRKNIKNNH